MDYQDLTATIAASFPRLSPRLRTAARHVLDRPDDVALNSMRRVAADAGVHPSTMVRLARALDFDSYNDFRAGFQTRFRSHPTDYTGRARELQARSDGSTTRVLADVGSHVGANLHDTFAANGSERFEACARAILKGRRVYVAGLRSCYPVAFFFHYIYGMFRHNAFLLTGGGGSFGDNLRGFGREDVLIAIGFEPYTRDIIHAVRYVRDLGGTVVVLTDTLVSPLLDKDADLALIIRNESASFFHSISPAIAVAEALAALIVVEEGEDALHAIEDSTSQLARFMAYWNAPTERAAGDARP